MGFYQQIAASYGPETSRKLKLWASLSNKLAAKINRRIFLLRCRKANLVPFHITNGSNNLLGLLNTSNNRIRNEINNFNSRLGLRTLNFEIKITISDINNLEKSLHETKHFVFNTLPQNIFIEFARRNQNCFKKKLAYIRKVNVTKFNRLCRYQAKVKLFHNNSKWFINLTDTVFPEEVKNLLSLGPKFSLPISPKELHAGRLLADIESILDKLPQNYRDIYRARVTNVITNFMRSHKKPVQWDAFSKCRQFIKEHQDIIITKADKGAVTVVISKDDYIKKAEDLVNDTNVYTLLKGDPTFTTQKKNNDFISLLKHNDILDEATVKRLTIHNAVTPKFYGLPKIHKVDTPLRPIVSSINSPTYKLSAFVAGVLTVAFNGINNYNTKDSFTFSSEFNNFQLPVGFVVISLDVVSLFTNIPVELVIQIINNKWELIEPCCNFTKDRFIQTINFIFNNTYFAFNNKFYKQVFGTPMGSPLSPVLATMVMDALFDDVIPQLPFQLPFIKKYVDDVVCAVPSDKINVTLTLFNSFNPHIQFTIEEESQSSIPFLDTRIIRTADNVLILDWYRKPTSSGRYINYYSNHPIGQKLNIVSGLKNRILKIAHPTLHRKNLDILLDILCNNGYPKALIKKILFSTPNPNILVPREGMEGDIGYRRLPYLEQLTPKLINILKNDQLKIAKYNVKTVHQLFSVTKDKTPVLSNSNVIYSIPCGECDSLYIGQTSQWLKTRITQHRSDCRINKYSCALAIHSINSNHIIDFHRVKILEKETNYKNRLFLEMVHINKTPNTLNFKTDVENLSSVYSYVLNFWKIHNNQNNNSTLHTTL